ncbi:hypothetical protein NFI00_000058 [Salmonella enterica]|nr:hypothetical protein [Salmonella enterica]
MENIELNAYIANVFRLARTMVIKIEAIAKRDNKLLKAAGYEVLSDKRTWRYYMNLNGEYHPTDDQMTVTSIDTGEEIVFNKTNLEIHMATFREYSLGGYWFNRLMERYPHQTDLIKGILSPIPYEETIAADDYKILRYNTNLVSWNEDQLIPALQRWINSEVAQTFKNDYMVTDDLMLPTMVMNLYAGLIQAIHTIRFEAIGTRYAHEFYIWSHIDSFGNFSKYKASLNAFQTMWLYRNIGWIQNNAGRKYTFDKLLQNLLTERNIPLAKYDMVLNTAEQLKDVTPDPQYRHLYLNLHEDYGSTPTYITTEQLLEKERGLARDNSDFMSTLYEEALERGKFSLYSELPTKVLESAMQDFTNRHADTLMTVVYNHWIYLAANNIFNATILLTDPKTSKQYRVSAAEAYQLWNYMVAKAKGKELIEVPLVWYNRVAKLNIPSQDQLLALGGKRYLDKPLVNDIRRLGIAYTRLVSSEGLLNVSKDIYWKMWEHKKLYSQFYDLNKRARVKNACDAMYESGYVKLTNYTSYKTLLEKYELDLADYTEEELRNFAWDIFQRVTGWDLNSNPSLRTIQSDLIDLMMDLSSYTIQIVKTMDDGTDVTELLNEPFVGDSLGVGEGNSMVPDFSGCLLNVVRAPLSQHSLDNTFGLPDRTVPEIEVSSQGFISLPPEAQIKPVLLNNDVVQAVRIFSPSYVTLLPDENPVVPGAFVIPDTDYGSLFANGTNPIPGDTTVLKANKDLGDILTQQTLPYITLSAQNLGHLPSTD